MLKTAINCQLQTQSLREISAATEKHLEPGNCSYQNS